MSRQPEIAFEFFPARTEQGAALLRETVRELSVFSPRFMSFTYGAGGSSREGTLPTVRAMARETEVPVAGHLTCVDASRQAVDDVARAYWDADVRHIVAVRGDPPTGVRGHYVPHPEGYAGALELITGLRTIAPFEISVAAYPDTHPAASSPEADLAHLKAKFDAGADRALTQFFFDSGVFLRFRDRAVAAGITQPIVPGIFPVGNVAQTWRLAAACGVSIPVWIRTLFDGLDEKPAVRSQVALAVADRLCQDLRREGVSCFNIYTLNQVETASALCRLLGVPPRPEPVSGSPAA